MRYAIVMLKEHQGVIVRPAWRTRRNERLLFGSLETCRAWIAGCKRAMVETSSADSNSVMLYADAKHSDAAECDPRYFHMPWRGSKNCPAGRASTIRIGRLLEGQDNRLRSTIFLDGHWGTKDAN